MVLKIGCFGIVMGVVPILIGLLFSVSGRDEKERTFLNAYVKGMITMLAVFQLLAVPFTFLEFSLSSLIYCFGAICAVLCLLSLVLNLRKFPRMITAAIRSLVSPWQVWLAVLFILLQAFVLSRYTHIDNDDAFYVATATTAQETDSIYQVNPYTGEEYQRFPARYVLASFPIYTAAIGQITGIHPTIIAHVGFAAVFLLFTYMVYAMIGNYLFPKQKKAIGYFLIFVSLLHVFSAYSIYTPGVFLLTRIWQGKAILAAALLPAVFFLTVQASRNKSGKSNWILLLLAMISCCMATSMGVLLSAVVVGITAVAAAVIMRNWKAIPYSFICCVPNLIYAGVYLLIR